MSHPLTEIASTEKLVVFIVEDDISLATALDEMLEECGFRTEIFSSGEAFLNRALKRDQQNDGYESGVDSAVVLLDIRLQQASGIDVFNTLKRKEMTSRWPVVFMTGHGDIETAVYVLKQGAFDFITKPFESQELIEKIHQAGSYSATSIKEKCFIEELTRLFRELTDKEREVMSRVVSGQTNKEIAEQLGNSSRTVEVHRAKIFDKLRVTNAVELSRLIERYRLLGGGFDV